MLINNATRPLRPRQVHLFGKAKNGLPRRVVETVKKQLVYPEVFRQHIAKSVEKPFGGGLTIVNQGQKIVVIPAWAGKEQG